MIRTSIVFILMLCLTSLYSQFWNGKGDGTSWHDPNNWNTDIVPHAGAKVIITKNVTITGTAYNNPSKIQINAGYSVTLDLDLSIDNNVVNDQGIRLQAGATLKLGTGLSNRIFNINVGPDKDAILLDGIEQSNLIIETNVILNIGSGKDGIRATKAPHSILNHGTINISGVVDDGIELLGGAIFKNSGELVIILPDGENSKSSGFLLGSNTEGGRLFNYNIGNINIDAGVGLLSKALQVFPLSTVQNYGFVTLINGNEGARIWNRGEINNHRCGFLDLTKGRINLNAAGASFENSGILLSTRNSGSSIMVTAGASATNKGFYKYLNSNNWAGGSGNITNSGINLNDPLQTSIDAAGACTADIAEETYTWRQNGKTIGLSDKTGLTIIYSGYDPSLPIYPSCYEGLVEINIDNLCLDLPVLVPTLGQWGIAILSLFLSIIGVLFIKQDSITFKIS